MPVPFARSGPSLSPVTTTTSSPADTSTAAHTESVTKVYGAGDTLVTALDNVSVSFERSKFTAIMGPSGSGKSTLIGDVDLSGLNDKQLTRMRRDTIGFVFQAFNLVPTLTALENITLPMDLAGRAPDQEWLDTIVATVGLGDRLSHRPSELSGGQQQRVAVARALASQPAIIFADEPTGNLDSRSGSEILEFMRTAVDKFSQTIVMVTHDPLAASYADRVVFLVDGKVVDDLQSPTTDSVIDRMKSFGA